MLHSKDRNSESRKNSTATQLLALERLLERVDPSQLKEFLVKLLLVYVQSEFVLTDTDDEREEYVNAFSGLMEFLNEVKLKK